MMIDGKVNGALTGKDDEDDDANDGDDKDEEGSQQKK